jgi:transcriptional regulator NrdR family protein
MKCPNCGGERSSVIDPRPFRIRKLKREVVRLRICHDCLHVFLTREELNSCCNGFEFRMVRSVSFDSTIKRYRECRICGKRKVTYEEIDSEKKYFESREQSARSAGA